MTRIAAVVTLSPRDYDAALFDLDGVLTRTASVHAAAWERLFDGFLEQRATVTGEAFVACDDELFETKTLNAMDDKLTAVIGDDHDLQPIPRFEGAHEVEHLWMGCGLGKHELGEHGAREGTLLMKHDPGQILVERHFALFVPFKGQLTPLGDVGKVETKPVDGLLTHHWTPAVGEQHVTNINE